MGEYDDVSDSEKEGVEGMVEEEVENCQVQFY